jgi:hypothetical protein
MSSNTEVNLAKAVQAVRASSPTGWATLLDWLEIRSIEITDNLLSSPAEHLQVMQGRAREARELIAVLKAAPALAEKLYDKERHNANRGKF